VVVNLETDLKRIGVKDEEKQVIRSEILHEIQKYDPTNLIYTGTKHQKIVNELKQKELYYIRGDKGKNIAIMYKSEYEQNMWNEIEIGPFTEIKDGRWKDGSPLNKLQNEVKRCLKELTDNHSLNKFHSNFLTNSNPKIPAVCGLPKLHKEGNRLRLVVSNIQSPTSKIGEYIVKEFRKFNYHSKYSIRNSIVLAENLRNIILQPDEILVSFDVVGLFPNVPINEALQMTKSFLDQQDIPENKKHILFEMIKLVIDQSIFQFRGKYYKQNNGVPIGNNISPIISEIFMKVFETQIENEPWFPRFYARYVDDIIVITKRNNVDTILININNTVYKKIQFTSELENDNRELAFLDLLLKREDSKLKFSIYRKPCDNDRFISSSSNHCTQHKEASLNFMIHRMLNIPMDDSDREKEWSQIINIAKVNGYSEKLCEKLLLKKTMKLANLNFSSLSKIDNNEDAEIVCLPFYPPFTNKIDKILRKHNLKAVYKNPGKISDLLGNPKDKIKEEKLQSGIYKINCKDCPSSYIGQTRRNLKIREREHQTLETSVVFKHCVENSHQMHEIKLLKRVEDSRLLDGYESYFLNKNKQDVLLNEQPHGNLPSNLYKLEDKNL